MNEVLASLPPEFTTVWLSDHLQQDGEPWPESWTLLTWLAATFPRFRFGNLVLGQGYRNPGLLGVMAQTFQELSHGRLILGLGAGWLEEEYRAFNYSYPSGAARVAQLGEAIQLMKTLWNQSPATFLGEWYQIENAVCERPEPPIPILVGTNGPRALKVVARLADWWIWDGPWEPSYRPAYQRLRAECEAIGRPFDEITLASELSVSMPAEPTTFRPTFEHEFYSGQVFRVTGPTPADVARDIEELVEVGVTHLALNFDEVSELRRFIDEVLPRLDLKGTREPPTGLIDQPTRESATLQPGISMEE